MAQASERPSARPPLRARAAVPLVGRERECAALVGLVTEGARLITVTGPAGVGKTRLVAETAEACAKELGGRALFARLDHATESAAVKDAVESAAARMLGQAGLSTVEILSALGPTLLVLDPIDLVLEQLEVVGSWLDACPELTVVLCGRARSQIHGERVLELEALHESASVDLFRRFAELSRPGFELKTKDDEEAARAIVTSLDNLPLALELAAPRLAVMTAPALLHRLQNRFDLLKRPSGGGGSPRHDTLEAAIRWSLELLEARPRALLEGTSVFRGGFSLEVAEAVLGGDGSVVDDLLHLRERSLLGVEEASGGEIRLKILESVRLVAERGLDPERKRALEEKHALSYVNAAETWARDVELLGSPDARTHLSQEHDNLAAVVERILGRGAVSARAADRALRVLVALGSVVSREGASALLRAHLESAIQVAQGSGADPRLLARALCLRGTLRAAGDQVAEGERDLAEALVLSSHSGDKAIEARVLLASASVAAREGQTTAARALLARAVQMAAASADKMLLVRAQFAEARIDLTEGALGRARLRLEETLAHARRAEDRALAADAERMLGLLELYEKNDAAAEGHLEAAAALAATLHDPGGGSEAARWLGIAKKRTGSPEATHFESALALARRAADPRAIAASAVLLALHFMGQGERGEARALLREAEPHLGRLEPDLRAAASRLLGVIEGKTSETSEKTASERAVAPGSPPSDPVLATLLGVRAASGPTLDLGALFQLRAASTSSPPAGPTASPARPSGRTLRLGVDGATFAVDGGTPVDLSRRRPLKKILAHLARVHATSAAASWDELLGAGWPGEKMRADAGAHRVRVAISTLRKMGLVGILETGEEGYRLQKGITLQLEP